MSAPLPRLGVRLHGGLPPLACVALAECAEQHGFASLWFAENPFVRGALPTAAACALATRRLAIGIGAVNPYNRHPTLIAMEAGALDELAEGRVRLGIGSGIGAMVRRMGFGYERPLSAVREAIDIVRAMLQGETVTFQGRVFSVAGAKLGYNPPRPDLPILMAAMGDRAIALCGEIADGLIISNMCPLGYTERAVALLRRAAAQSGRPLPEIVQYVPCRPGHDRAEARESVKGALGEMLTSFWPTTEPWPPWRETIIEKSGIPRAEVAAALTRLRRGEPAAQVLDERYVDAFAIAGTAEECLERARAYRRAGVGELALGLVGPRPQDDIALLAGAAR
ncbi:MAG TPA: LLM class flavin-dependent oxidoreductase [Stellaceae bacterium]|nr:LLM class flavin-dependent oxidoreductase [Stellaceae bacterium]